jgi:hypothetical protein
MKSRMVCIRYTILSGYHTEYIHTYDKGRVDSLRNLKDVLIYYYTPLSIYGFDAGRWNKILTKQNGNYNIINVSGHTLNRPSQGFRCSVLKYIINIPYTIYFSAPRDFFVPTRWQWTAKKFSAPCDCCAYHVTLENPFCFVNISFHLLLCFISGYHTEYIHTYDKGRVDSLRNLKDVLIYYTSLSIYGFDAESNSALTLGRIRKFHNRFFINI